MVVPPRDCKARKNVGNTRYIVRKRQGHILTTVTKRIRAVKQPRGGFINPRLMEVRNLSGESSIQLDLDSENLSASLVGTAVDYLTRLANGSEPGRAFAIPLAGARLLGETVFESAFREVEALVPGQVDSQAIIAACKLAGYDVAYRAGLAFYNSDAKTTPDASTIDQIAVMVQRALSFFEEYGPVTLDGFSFSGGYTEIVTAGDGDFLTNGTVWDFKVSVNPPTKDHTLQLAMYYLMGQRSAQPHFDNITHLGVFNPRLNTVYRVALADVPVEVIEAISRDVIGYH